MTCPLTVSLFQPKPTCKLIHLLPMQDLTPTVIPYVLCLMHPCANFLLVLSQSQTASPHKSDILLSICHSVNTSSNPVPGRSVTILTGTCWALICLLTPSTCTSPSSLLTAFSPQAKLSTDKIPWRVHIVRHTEKLNPTNIFCAVHIRHDFIFGFS